MKTVKIRTALISLTDKTGAAGFAKGLAGHGVEVISTGGTAAVLRESGIRVIDVSDVTGFPEIMSGRVKTLHPLLFGGVLGLADDKGHAADMKEHGIRPIDLVAVNLYAFSEKISEPGITPHEAMNSVDIGGPSMIRAAAKNHDRVLVVVDPRDYELVLEEMDEKGGGISHETRSKMAIKAFDLTAAYDACIHTYLRESRGKKRFPVRLILPTGRGVKLRYGENPHQAARFYPMERHSEPSVSGARVLSGKKLSYNNILDTDAAFELVKEFNKEPAAVIVKHTNPCGTATAATAAEAFLGAYQGDPISAFGGIAALNRPVDEELAEVIADPDRFLEVLIAPDISDKAVDVLKKKVKWGKRLRILSAGPLDCQSSAERGKLTFRSVTGGVLVQDRDLGVGDDPMEPVTKAKPNEGVQRSLRFAWKVVKHVRSNAIVLAGGTRIVGVGAGQMSRIEAMRIAGVKAGSKAAGGVMASDAFFPFRDCVDLAAEFGIKAVIQPGGSVRDSESIEAADEHGIAMVFTGKRHFRH